MTTAQYLGISRRTRVAVSEVSEWYLTRTSHLSADRHDDGIRNMSKGHAEDARSSLGNPANVDGKTDIVVVNCAMDSHVPDGLAEWMRIEREQRRGDDDVRKGPRRVADSEAKRAEGLVARSARSVCRPVSENEHAAITDRLDLLEPPSSSPNGFSRERQTSTLRRPTDSTRIT